MATNVEEKKKKKKKGFLSSFYISSKSSLRSDRKSKSELAVAPASVVKTTMEVRPVENDNVLKMRLDRLDEEMISSEHSSIHVRGTGRRGVETGGGNLVVEARRSVSHVETNISSVAAFLQVKVLVADMPGFMQVHAFRCARRTYDTSDSFSSKHMAYNMKKEFDKVYGPAWHCIVGSSFGSFVTHATGCFLYFSVENIYILLFKTKLQKAHLPQL